MTKPNVQPKWRPSLGLVVVSVLLSVLALPVAFVVWFRRLDGIALQMGPVEFGALAVALVLTLLVALVLTRTISGPIAALVRRSEVIGSGGRDAIRPLARYGTREIATLSQSFLDLAGRLVDRSEYVQSFAAHVSHELKSPLTAIKGAAELLRDDQGAVVMTVAERHRFLDLIAADADRLTTLLARLRELAHAELPMAAGATSVGAVAAVLAGRFGGLAVVPSGAMNRRLQLSLEAASIVFGHLAENAAQHGASRLELAARIEAGMVTIVVADDGSGISAGNQALVLQPFFTTRREQGGTGMGLDISRAMLRAHGGSIRLLHSTVGAAFEISLPAAP